MSMKPRSPVAALLAITETLLAAKAARSARAKQPSPVALRRERLAEHLDQNRPPLLRTKTHAIS